MIKSMTAFARVQADNASGTLTWELRSVNHRYLDISCRLPEDLRMIEGRVREIVGERIKRGKLECNLRYVPSRDVETGIQVNEEYAGSVLEACQKINNRLHQPSEINPMDVLNWPGVVAEPERDMKQVGGEAERLLNQALDELIETREREGERMRELIQQRCASMQGIVHDVREKLPEVRQRYRDKLLARIRELELEPEQERVEQELLFLAQKMDVDEELDRLDAHLKEIDDVMSRNEPVGRRLDFLMQEFNREANTLGSKSADISTTQASVELKVLIEQMREQIQNIE